MIIKEKEQLNYVRKLKYMCPKLFKKSEVNDLYNKTKELIKLKREIYIKFKESNYKNIDKYIENELNIEVHVSGYLISVSFSIRYGLF